MNITLPLSMIRRIKDVLEDASAGSRPIQVYAEAEKVRRIHPEANIALEDIVERFILMGRRHAVAFEIDPAHAVEAVMGTERASCQFRATVVTHQVPAPGDLQHDLDPFRHRR